MHKRGGKYGSNLVGDGELGEFGVGVAGAGSCRVLKLCQYQLALALQCRFQVPNTINAVRVAVRLRGEGLVTQ